MILELAAAASVVLASSSSGDVAGGAPSLYTQCTAASAAVSNSIRSAALSTSASTSALAPAGNSRSLRAIAGKAVSSPRMSALRSTIVSCSNRCVLSWLR